ncbi:MAG: deoxyribose-phosphate aldolase [Candidatus Thermoplasmatota archaeon]
MEIEKFLDHTILNPDARKEDVKEVCDEAKTYNFASVCVNPCWVSLVDRRLKGTDISTCSVVGFPLGANNSETKAFEAKKAVEEGADEIDMVLNIGKLKEGDHSYVEEDIRAVVESVDEDPTVKVIIEACLLTDEEKIKACEIAKEAGADFVKTSTGFAEEGAKLEDVRTMRETVGDAIGVKAAGGIGSYEKAKEMIEAGASRIGASSSVEIAEGKPHDR